VNFGRNYQRQYPTRLPERILPDHFVEFDEEWRYTAYQWLCFHPWDKEFRTRYRKVEESGEVRDFETDYFTLEDAMRRDCYQYPELLPNLVSTIFLICRETHTTS
jgi:hypothetical protein